MTITGVHHINIQAGSIEQYNKTIEFYRDILGLPIIRTWGEGNAMIDAGNTLIEIMTKPKETHLEGILDHFALAADDTDGIIERIRSAGYEITVEPKDIAIPSNPPFPARIAFCIGSCREIIEIFQEK